MIKEKTITITHTELKNLFKKPPIFKIAKENLKRGDICIMIWNKYCRLAQQYDYKNFSIAFRDYKKGEEALLVFEGEVKLSND